MFKLNDKVKGDYYGEGEVILIEDGCFVIAWNEYNEGLMTSDEYDEFDLPSYDDRFYGTYSKRGIKNHNIHLYTLEEELKDIDEKIEFLNEKKRNLLK